MILRVETISTAQHLQEWRNTDSGQSLNSPTPPGMEEYWNGGILTVEEEY